MEERATSTNFVGALADEVEIGTTSECGQKHTAVGIHISSKWREAPNAKRAGEQKTQSDL